MRRPGDRLRAFAARVCSVRALERIIDPAVADLQHEYDSAMGDGRQWRAHIALLVGYVGLAKVLIVCALRSPFADAASVDGRGGLRSTARIALVSFVIVTALLVLPPSLQGAPVPDGASRVMFFLFLVPQAVPVAIPFALSLGILCGLRGRTATLPLVWGVIAIAVIGCLASLVTMEWVIPEANQAWREMIAGAIGKPIRGVGETSLSELFGRSDPYSVQLFHIRAALGFAAIVFSVLAMALAPLIRRRTTAALCALSCPFAYIGWSWIVYESVPGEWIPVAWAAWMPNVLLMGVGVLVLFLTRAHRRDALARTE
jgi:hypothetical protein